MCILVDTNVLNIFLAEPTNEKVAPIRNWLLKKGGQLVYSTDGRFSSEVSRNNRIKLMSYAQAGIAKLVPASTFGEDEDYLKNSGNLKSDDPHVLALARYSGARILYSRDKNLRDDFRDKKIIDNPRGKIYSDQRQSHLLTKSACSSIKN